MSAPPVIVVAGTASGVGKTSVATGLMAALRRAGHVVQGAKVGPDFIDPGFHALATGRPARNLDAWLSGPDLLVPLLRHATAGADVTVVEGVMGLFDGARPDDDLASTAALAVLLQAPVLLVVDASAMARSVAAMVHGYATFDPRLRLGGVVLNRVGSDGHADLLRTALAPLGIPVLGALPQRDALHTPSRHLGLVPVAEHDAEARQVVAALGEWVTAGIDLEGVMALARGARVPAAVPWAPEDPGAGLRDGATRQGGVRIAVAAGPAFSFRYTENMEVLTAAGAELVHVDPLVDSRLPEGTAALYLGGGFPEVHAEALAANRPMLQAVAAHAAAGLPVVAECGGQLYLSRHVGGIGQAGVLPAAAQMAEQLTMGYRTATAAADSVLWRAGEVVQANEFHRTTTSPQAGRTPAWLLEDVAEGFVQDGVHASYLHTHWAATPHVGARLVGAARVAAARARVGDGSSSVTGPPAPDAAGPLRWPRASPAARTLAGYQPAGAVTGVGSLPLTDPSDALAFVAAHAPEVPFWPQLPLRGSAEGMLRQTLGDPLGLIEPIGGVLRVLDGRTAALIEWLDDAPAAIGPQEAVGFAAFLRALRRGMLPAARALKGQLTGPLTLAAFLQVEGRPAAEHPELAAALVRRVTARAAWQTRALTDHGLPTVVVLDEPVLGVVGSTGTDQADAVLRVLQAIRDNGGIAGLHSCATGPLDPPVGVAPDLWSLDLHGRGGVLPAAVRDRWAGGGLLAAGLVPTVAQAGQVPPLADLAAMWRRAAEGGGEVAALAGRTLVTASCGLAGNGTAAAEASFQHAARLGQHLRRTAADG